LESFPVSFQRLPVDGALLPEPDDVIVAGYADLPDQVTHGHGTLGDAVDLNVVAVPG
jgi:hypothetical protein